MAANYLHGAETIEIKKGPSLIQVVKSGVIGLTGTASKGTKNTLKVITNLEDGIAEYGEELTGFTIPQALAAIFAQGQATVMVVSVGWGVPVAVAAETLTVDTSTGITKLAFNPIVDAVVLKTNDGTTDTVLATTKYTIDVFGNIVITDSATLVAIEADDIVAVKATYKKYDSSTVNSSALIGTIDGTTNVRTGMKCYDLAYSTFGYKAKIFICPGYSATTTIANELSSLADKNRGRYITDAPVGATPAVAIAARGPLGTSANFYTSNRRALLAYPGLKAYDKATDADQVRPYSQFLAGVIAAVHLNEGYWVSLSNHEIKGITGLERTITAAINDASTEANQLNEVGIITVFNAFGSGTRSWGNHNAKFPSATTPDTFDSILTVADVINESIELAMLPYIDRPINQGLIDTIRQSVNSFMNTLISRGAIIDGSCTFDKSKNSDEEIAAGHLVFDYSFMPPPPMERVTFNSFIDITLLGKLA